MVNLVWTDAQRKIFKTTKVLDDIEQASYDVTYHSGHKSFKVSWHIPYNKYSPPASRLRIKLIQAFWNMEYRRRFGI